MSEFSGKNKTNPPHNSTEQKFYRKNVYKNEMMMLIIIIIFISVEKYLPSNIYHDFCHNDIEFSQ